MKTIRNIIWALSGFGFKTIVQALYFIVLARTLGPGKYGIFAAALALVYILVPFSTWGAGSVLIKNVARDKEKFREYWGSALISLSIFGCFFFVIAILLYFIILSDKVDILPVIILCLSELFFARIVDICVQAYQAFELISRAALLQILFGLNKLVLTLLFAFFITDHSINIWVLLYLFSSIIAAIFCFIIVSIELGRPRFVFLTNKNNFFEGLYFSLSNSSSNTYNDFDKSILPRYTTLETTGNYSVAYRIIDALTLPINSVLFTFYARFFQKGEAGLSSSKKFALKLFPLLFSYSLLIVSLTMIFSNHLLDIFGNSYKEMVYIIPILSPIIIFRSIHSVGSDALTGAGMQGRRSAAQISVAIINAILCLWLIPKNGWVGAVWASLISDGILALLIWGCIFLSSQTTKINIKPQNELVN